MPVEGEANIKLAQVPRPDDVVQPTREDLVSLAPERHGGHLQRRPSRDEDEVAHEIEEGDVRTHRSGRAEHTHYRTEGVRREHQGLDSAREERAQRARTVWGQSSQDWAERGGRSTKRHRNGCQGQELKQASGPFQSWGRGGLKGVDPRVKGDLNGCGQRVDGRAAARIPDLQSMERYTS